LHQIDEISGVLRTQQPVDYEELREIDFLALASDGVFEDTVPVTITIQDVNDNRPVFDCSNRVDNELYTPDYDCFYNLQLLDNTLLGYNTLTLNATDIDTVSRKYL